MRARGGSCYLREAIRVHFSIESEREDMAETSYANDIKPLFRDKDRDSMQKAFDLWSLQDVRDHSQKILEALKSGKMPCDGPWPASDTELFERWVAEGMNA
jgi:hypothetical protein